MLHFIKTIMCCIQNFHIDWIIDYQREESESGVKAGNIGRIEKDNIYFTPDEISYLTKKYVLLYRNRQDKFQENLKNHHYAKSVQKGKLGETHDYNPNVSEKNKLLAEKRLMDQNPDLSKMAIEDRLCAQKQMTNESMFQRKMEEEAQEADHSFHPTLSDASVMIALSKRP